MGICVAHLGFEHCNILIFETSEGEGFYHCHPLEKGGNPLWFGAVNSSGARVLGQCQPGAVWRSDGRNLTRFATRRCPCCVSRPPQPHTVSSKNQQWALGCPVTRPARRAGGLSRPASVRAALHLSPSVRERIPPREQGGWAS